MTGTQKPMTPLTNAAYFSAYDAFAETPKMVNVVPIELSERLETDRARLMEALWNMYYGRVGCMNSAEALLTELEAEK